MEETLLLTSQLEDSAMENCPQTSLVMLISSEPIPFFILFIFGISH